MKSIINMKMTTAAVNVINFLLMVPGYQQVE